MTSENAATASATAVASAAPLGSFTFVLHSHLPYVLSHGKWPHGTEWACEAAAETYIPLLNVFHRLLEENIEPRVTLGLTPVLCEMLSDADFLDEFGAYLQTKIEAARENAREFAALEQHHFRDNALFWENWYCGIARDFDDKYNRDIVGAFRALQDGGHLEIITCAATHGYLPLLGTDESVQAQIAIGVATYKKHFGRAPRGIWLPECAYRPRYEWSAPVGENQTPKLRKGIEEFLAENGLEYFIADAHLLAGGTPIGAYGDRYNALKTLYDHAAAQHETAQLETAPREYSPMQVYNVASSEVAQRNAPVAVFSRHEKTALQVWSGDHGYPGEGYYLDFHKKHFPGGHRLWRVTSSQADLAEKLPYEPDKIAYYAQSHADHFVGLVTESLREYSQQNGGPSGLVCAPYDAELFGHWWFEGPQWLYRTLKKMAQTPEINLTTCGAYLDENPTRETVRLPEGSWGEGGFHFIWLNENTDWTWREIYRCEAEMTRLAREYSQHDNPKLQEILSQCGRELLLMESSDWQFLISTVSARDYAELRIAGHINDFQSLAAMADKVARGEQLSDGEGTLLENVRQRDRAFQNIDVSLWAGVEHPAEEEA